MCVHKEVLIPRGHVADVPTRGTCQDQSIPEFETQKERKRGYEKDKPVCQMRGRLHQRARKCGADGRPLAFSQFFLSWRDKESETRVVRH